MKAAYCLTINLEHQNAPKISQILETIELGEFETEDEAREALEQIMEAADMEFEEEGDEPE